MPMPPGLSALPRGCFQLPFIPQIDSRRKVGHADLYLWVPSQAGALLFELGGPQLQAMLLISNNSRRKHNQSLSDAWYLLGWKS